jgi:hypothetical protein
MLGKPSKVLLTRIASPPTFSKNKRVFLPTKVKAFS